MALYNDAYFPVIGSKHPGALGRPVRECWAELLHVLYPLLDGVVESGEAFWAHDHPFPLRRHGFLERTYFDNSYDPVPVEDGRVGGVLCLVTDTTGRVLSQRRMRTLSQLGVATAGVQQAGEVARQVSTVLADNPDDVPFAQIYLREGDALCRSASAPATWFISGGTQRDIDLALISPITSGTGIEGALVAGVNPLFRLPGAYRPDHTAGEALHGDQYRSRTRTEDL